MIDDEYLNLKAKGADAALVGEGETNADNWNRTDEQQRRIRGCALWHYVDVRRQGRP